MNLWTTHLMLSEPLMAGRMQMMGAYEPESQKPYWNHSEGIWESPLVGEFPQLSPTMAGLLCASEEPEII